MYRGKDILQVATLPRKMSFPPQPTVKSLLSPEGGMGLIGLDIEVKKVRLKPQVAGWNWAEKWQHGWMGVK